MPLSSCDICFLRTLFFLFISSSDKLQYLLFAHSLFLAFFLLTYCDVYLFSICFLYFFLLQTYCSVYFFYILSFYLFLLQVNYCIHLLLVYLIYINCFYHILLPYIIPSLCFFDNKLIEYFDSFIHKNKKTHTRKTGSFYASIILNK